MWRLRRLAAPRSGERIPDECAFSRPNRLRLNYRALALCHSTGWWIGWLSGREQIGSARIVPGHHHLGTTRQSGTYGTSNSDVDFVLSLLTRRSCPLAPSRKQGCQRPRTAGLVGERFRGDAPPRRLSGRRWDGSAESQSYCKPTPPLPAGARQTPHPTPQRSLWRPPCPRARRLVMAG